LSIPTWSLTFSSLGGSLSTPARHLDGDSREKPFPSNPHGPPREAGGHQKRLLWLWGIFLLLGPPSSTWAVSVSLTGTRLADQASTQRFPNPLADCKSLISNIGEPGCVRSVLGAGAAPLPQRINRSCKSGELRMTLDPGAMVHGRLLLLFDVSGPLWHDGHPMTEAFIRAGRRSTTSRAVPENELYVVHAPSRRRAQ